MAAFDFPASPSIGQKYPASPVAGVPTYTWDGEKWTTIGGATGGGMAVLYDTVQTLTAPQQQQARQNIYAAPFDAMAYSGLQINGAMEVSQEKGTAGTGANGSYICDGWKFYWAGTMSVGVAAAASTVFPGFPYNLITSMGTAQASLGAGDFVQVMTQIEGFRIARLQWGTANAQPITIGFWTAHHRTGLYSGVVGNVGGTRSYAFTYTQAAADVPQYNTVTIPGDTTGAWATDNTVGLSVHFAIASGATFTAPSANAWLAGNYIAAPGQVNGVGAMSDLFRITGVVVLPGNEAPSAARSPFIMRPYDQELVLCQRYYQSIGTMTFWGCLTGPSQWNTPVFFSKMRAPPTVTALGAAYVNASSFVLTSIGTQYLNAGWTVPGAGATQVALTGLTLDARL